MENSSKALLIAGGVLIAVLILSLFVYLYLTMHNFSNEYNSNIDIQKLQAFNAQFEVYNRENLTAQDIVTVANMADEYNNKNDILETNDKYISVIANNNKMNNLTAKAKYKFMNDYKLIINADKTKQNTFSCSKIEYDSSGKVNYLEFKKNSYILSFITGE